MTIDKGIPIKNVYYMLAYAFKELKRNNYERIQGEDFDDIHDLFAEILALGIACLLKQGLHRQYITQEEALQTLRGKLSMQQTLKRRMARDTRLVCEYDSFSADNVFNRILKTSVLLLLRHSDVKAERKAKLRRLMIYFDAVEEIPPFSIRWDALRYDRNTRTYQMLHSLCFFLLQSRLLTTASGEVKMERFADADMNLLFQRFVMEYYRKKHPECRAQARQIRWNVCGHENVSLSLLPIMQTDITLSLADRTLVIDTKYYGKTLRENWGKMSIHSPHLYQIHTYVMNEDPFHTGRVDGMLLYARTASDIQPDARFKNHDGNIFMVRTLDLCQDFGDIERQLDELLKYKL